MLQNPFKDIIALNEMLQMHSVTERTSVRRNSSLIAALQPVTKNVSNPF